MSTKIFERTILLDGDMVRLEVRLVAEREVDYTINGISVTREDFLAVKHCHDTDDMREAIGINDPKFPHEKVDSVRDSLDTIVTEINALRFAIVDGTT